jgi:hypothetical protein
MEEIQPPESPLKAIAIEHKARSLLEDSEKRTVDYLQLENTSIQSYSWEHISVEVKDRKIKQPLKLLNNVSGYVAAGENLVS